MRLDVLRRFVSVEKARAAYGVVVDPVSIALDESATEALRGELRADRPEEPDLFDFGEARRGQAGATTP